MSDKQSAANKTAYVILSHRNPEQITRLVQTILRLSPNAGVLVYHDARSSAPPLIDNKGVLVVTHTRPSDWGSWELVLNTIDAFRRAREELDPDLVVLMSGQDYPTRNLASWENEFFANGGGWVGTAWPLQYQPRWGKPHGAGDDDLTRYIYRWHRIPFSRALAVPRGRGARAVRWALDKLGHYLEPALDVREVTRGRGLHLGLRAARSPFGTDTPCYRGSQWLALDRSHLDLVLSRHDNDNRLRATYRRSIIPDESYFQTMLVPQSPPQSGPPLTYVEWVVADDAPRILTLDHLAEIVQSGSPLCRKVEPGLSDALVERLDVLAPTR